MRTSPVVGKKAWFGPRRLGWGLEPVSLEGWLVTFAMAAAAMAMRRSNVSSRWARYAMLGAFILFAVLKGSAPGGPGARSEFDTARVATRTSSEENSLLVS